MKKMLLGLLLGTVLVIGSWSVSIRADEVKERESEVQEIEDTIKKEEERQKKAEENAAWVRVLRNRLQKELDAAQLELDAILDELNDLNRQAEDTEELVDYYLQQRVESEDRLANQKAAMALRIQYTYETGSASFWEILFGARSLGEILNSAEYIRSMSSYDKDMMTEYEATLAECSENLSLMMEEQDRLVALLEQSAEKEAEYTAKTDEMLAKINQYNASAAEYTEQALVYADEVARQQEKLEEAKEAARIAAEEAARREQEEKERQARAEAAAKAAAEAEQARIQSEREALLAATPEEKKAAQEAALIASDRRAVGSIIIDGDLYNPSGYTNLQLLAAIIDCEAGGQTYEGKVAVGNVIMNRILDPRFQTTIYDVVYGPGQFSPVKNGFLARKLKQGATEACYEAARDVLDGVCVIPREYLYFCTPELFAKKPPKNYKSAITVCWHVFYYY
ncbi:MAG: cell wall hydrolase [Lachnospiraceae bacterium]|nr:cell wall hydrolase [Lachnospiraceae bacterium]